MNVQRAVVRIAELAGWLTLVREDVISAYLGQHVQSIRRLPITDSEDDDVEELVNKPELVWNKLRQEVASGEQLATMRIHGGYLGEDESYDIAKMGVSMKAQSKDPTLDRDYVIFWLHYRRGLSPLKISRLPLGLSPSAVENVLLHLIRIWRANLFVRTFSEPKN